MKSQTQHIDPLLDNWKTNWETSYLSATTDTPSKLRIAGESPKTNRLFNVTPGLEYELSYTQSENASVNLFIEESDNGTSWQNVVSNASSNGTQTVSFTPNASFLKVSFEASAGFKLQDVSLNGELFDALVVAKTLGGTGYRYGFNGMERDDNVKGAGNSYDFGARIYDPRIARFITVDPLADIQPDKTPYHFVSNNPINRIDPDGRLDEWVEKDGQMMYDNRVTNQDDATALYGEGAKYRPNGYNYRSSDGSDIELGDYGFFKQNGQIKSSPDLAASSLAYSNPSQAMSNAQSEIAGVRGNYTASVGVIGFISTDAGIPDITDVAWPKWVAYAVVGSAAAYYVAKMEREIEGIKRRAGGPQGVQYSLRATSSGNYPCFTCGGGTMGMGVGDVWKYGETTNPTGRYSDNWLRSNGLQQFNEFRGNQVQIKVMEKTKIYNYFLQNGHLPPGNKIFR